MDQATIHLHPHLQRRFEASLGHNSESATHPKAGGLHLNLNPILHENFAIVNKMCKLKFSHC